MANVFVLLRDEKKSPEVNKKRQIPLSTLHDLKSGTGSSGCEKSLMVSAFIIVSEIRDINLTLLTTKIIEIIEFFKNIKMAKRL